MSLLPDDVTAELLTRWREPHRRYHGISHLDDGLAVLAELGADDPELIAYWFHDAVHTNTSPDDELASAELARRLLAPHLTHAEVDRVCRLILTTITHVADDEAGARVVDVDLHGLGLSWERYLINLEGIRAETSLSDEEWSRRRVRFVERLLARDFIFATALGRKRWEAPARENLEREARQLRSAPKGTIG